MRRALALACQHQPLANAEAMLFVDNDHRKIAIGNLVLKDRMSTHHDVDTPVEQSHKRALTRFAFVTASQQGNLRSRRFGHAAQAFIMLAGEDFRRRK